MQIKRKDLEMMVEALGEVQAGQKTIDALLLGVGLLALEDAHEARVAHASGLDHPFPVGP